MALRLPARAQALSRRPYILTGYSTATRAGCTFSIHNETLNIWTHVVGIVVFALQLPRALRTQDSVLCAYVSAALVMFVCSVFYHTTSVHEPAQHARALAVDFFGIGLFIATSQAAGVHYAFWCDVGARAAHLLAIAILFGISVALSARRSTARRWRWYALLTALGSVPLLHHVLALHSGEHEGTSAGQRAFVRAFGYYTVGFAFFVTRAPERFAPGVFDIVAQSHQFWHLLVVCGALEYLHALRLAAAHAAGRACV